MADYFNFYIFFFFFKWSYSYWSKDCWTENRVFLHINWRHFKFINTLKWNRNLSKLVLFKLIVQHFRIKKKTATGFVKKKKNLFKTLLFLLLSSGLQCRQTSKYFPRLLCPQEFCVHSGFPYRCWSQYYINYYDSRSPYHCVFCFFTFALKRSEKYTRL